jgi:FtsP/CotA-like multicopper oxidase with cupredoxin domain
VEQTGRAYYLTAMTLHRRHILTGSAALAGVGALPAWAQHGSPGATPQTVLSGDDIKLTIGHSRLRVDGREGHAVAINGSVPGPLIRLREGQVFRCAVTNQLDEDTSIHWHGLILPFEMDGVPGVSFPGIRPGETFVYEFPIRQSGTYWYHSHSGLQELSGHYAPMIIDPSDADPVAYDREHIVVLSDYSFIHSHRIVDRLKQQGGYFNRQKQTVAGLLAGQDQPLADRLAWGRMRMDPTDILDVTAATYTYLVNGHGPKDNWTALFRPGERVRLRFINAASMTVFNLRIPGLPMTVVQADGAHVRPVEVDELQIANAETYDVVVTPTAEAPYAIVAEAIDSSGQAVATLAPRLGMRAPAPPLRKRPLLTMRDMGMGDMAGMDHGAHAGHAMSSAAVKASPGNQMVSPTPADRIADRGTGLDGVEGRVLTYAQLTPLQPQPDAPEPTRTLDIHLTGNMERFMWSMDGVKYSDRPDHFAFRHGERVRVTLINDTMMNHPIHLHGHFFELVNGQGAGRQPLKHTVNVMPGGKLSFDLTASELGDWAFHCHMLLHMHAGMFNVVTVRHIVEGEA